MTIKLSREEVFRIIRERYGINDGTIAPEHLLKRIKTLQFTTIQKDRITFSIDEDN
tara:strand:- start:467 stop:634 length:168 start_codon:yes stop_codon:yes gene_type:complete